MILSIDIGGTKLAAALINHQEIVDHRRLPTPGNGNPEALTAALKELLEPLLPEATEVVVASTGLICNGRLSAVNPDNLGGLNQYPLQKVLEKICGIPVKLLNDAQAAAWGEYCQLDRLCNDMAFITVSTGVGGGLIINGKLLTGTGGFSGHIGHTVVNMTGPSCGCGRQGCVESVASGTAIARIASEFYQQNVDAREVFRRSRTGDPEAARIVAESAQAIAALLANLKATLDIELAVIGGSVGLAEGYLSKVNDFIQQQPELYQVAIRPASLGHEAGIKGAALWAEAV